MQKIVDNTRAPHQHFAGRAVLDPLNDIAKVRQQSVASLVQMIDKAVGGLSTIICSYWPLRHQLAASKTTKTSQIF